MTDEAVVARWIDGLVKQAESEEMLGRALVTIVQTFDGRRFRVTIEPTKHAEELHAESMARILGQIGRAG